MIQDYKILTPFKTKIIKIFIRTPSDKIDRTVDKNRGAGGESRNNDPRKTKMSETEKKGGEIS